MVHTAYTAIEERREIYYNDYNDQRQGRRSLHCDELSLGLRISALSKISRATGLPGNVDA